VAGQQVAIVLGQHNKQAFYHLQYLGLWMRWIYISQKFLFIHTEEQTVSGYVGWGTH